MQVVLQQRSMLDNMKAGLQSALAAQRPRSPVLTEISRARNA
jgi:hypothetical protein